MNPLYSVPNLWYLPKAMLPAVLVALAGFVIIGVVCNCICRVIEARENVRGNCLGCGRRTAIHVCGQCLGHPASDHVPPVSLGGGRGAGKGSPPGSSAGVVPADLDACSLRKASGSVGLSVEADRSAEDKSRVV